MAFEQKSALSRPNLVQFMLLSCVSPSFLPLLPLLVEFGLRHAVLDIVRMADLASVACASSASPTVRLVAAKEPAEDLTDDEPLWRRGVEAFLGWARRHAHTHMAKN